MKRKSKTKPRRARARLHARAKQRPKRSVTSRFRALHPSTVYEIVAKTGLTMAEWYKVMDDCGRAVAKPQDNVKWLKEKFHLPREYAARIQLGYSTRTTRKM